MNNQEKSQHLDSQTKERHRANRQTDGNTDIKWLIMKLLPIIIKIVLAVQHTDKLAGIIELGETLEEQSLVS